MKKSSTPIQQEFHPSERYNEAIAFVASSAKRASAQRLSIAVSLRLISDLGDRRLTYGLLP